MKRALPLFLLLAIALLIPLTAQQTNHFVTLTWKWDQGIGDPATGFHIQRSNTTGGPYTVVGTLPLGPLFQFTDNTVAGGKTYFYVVTAFDQAGDSVLSNEVSCPIPFQIPANPTGLQGIPK